MTIPLHPMHPMHVLKQVLVRISIYPLFIPFLRDNFNHRNYSSEGNLGGMELKATETKLLHNASKDVIYRVFVFFVGNCRPQFSALLYDTTGVYSPPSWMRDVSESLFPYHNPFHTESKWQIIIFLTVFQGPVLKLFELIHYGGKTKVRFLYIVLTKRGSRVK